MRDAEVASTRVVPAPVRPVSWRADRRTWRSPPRHLQPAQARFGGAAWACLRRFRNWMIRAGRKGS